jgi:uncharacterized protein with PQ loop repeat
MIGPFLSLFFGITNLSIWFFIAIPQIYKNYKMDSSDAVSYLMYLKWLIGGSISLFIALIKKTSITIIYVGIHHLIIDIILLTQLIYYRIKKKTYITLNELIITIILLSIEILLFVYIFNFEFYKEYIIEILAWGANILFSISIFQQMYLNYKRKSTNGLSKKSFTSMIFCDIFFILSILSNVIDPIDNLNIYERVIFIIYKNIQWLSSCFIKLFCSIIILYQFNIYDDEYISLEDSMI